MIIGQVRGREAVIPLSVDGNEITIPVQESNGDPLVGMSLLYGCDVQLRVLDGGAVTISQIP